jgi:hypothetical protein
MLRHTHVRRSLALAAVVAATTWSTGALPAAADPGHGRGNDGGQGTGHGQRTTDQAGHRSGTSTTSTKNQPGKHAGRHDTRKSGPRPTGKPTSPPVSKPAGKPHGSPAKGSTGSPAGNNGTVKIAPYGSIDTIPNNTPHVGCTFLVEWYGYDEGADVVSTVSFAMQAPTRGAGPGVSGPGSVFVGGDPGRGAGNDGLDGREAYTLSFDGAPHPKQGYHVKLTVSTPRSLGNDTKTKVFWVQPCEAGETPPEEQPPGETPPEEQPPVVSPPEPAYPGVPEAPPAPPVVTSNPALPPAGPAAPGTPTADTSAVPTSVDAGLAGAAGTTGSSAPLVLLALGGGLGGLALVARRRRPTTVERRR